MIHFYVRIIVAKIHFSARITKLLRRIVSLVFTHVASLRSAKLGCGSVMLLLL